MKTAMQELIEKLNNVKPTEFCSIDTIREWSKELLEKENKQIMDSWKEGTEYIMNINDNKNIKSMSAIDYLIYFKTEKTDYYTNFNF
jgi:hypothetical protein